MVRATSYNNVTIAIKKLQRNYSILTDEARASRILCMIKADAYGHGMVQCAKSLEEIGCTVFGVAELREALILREAGIKSTIFSMMGFDDCYAELVVKNNIVPVVYDKNSLKALSSASQSSNTETVVYLKIDTGMSRLGIFPEQLPELIQVVNILPNLRLGGLVSHFPTSDDVSSPVTLQCYEKFELAKKVLPETDDKYFNHIANSGGTLNFKETHEDMVRCGIALYGYYPDGKPRLGDQSLQPVMAFSTRVIQVKDIPAGVGISYGHTFITQRKTRLAVLPVGYEDGYSRKLSNCGEVIIRGKKAPIRGRICMNICMVDVTDHDNVEPGDETVLLGSQGEEAITADDLAERCGTISYEILCMIGNNNERKYIYQ